MSMSRKAMFLMAVVLVLATAATAATAFAGTKKRFPPVSRQVVEAIEVSSDAARATTIKSLKLRTQRDIRTTVGFKAPVRR